MYGMEESLGTRRYVLSKYDGRYPWMGVRKFLEFSGMNQAFDTVVDSFTDKSLLKPIRKCFYGTRAYLLKKYTDYGRGLTQHEA